MSSQGSSENMKLPLQVLALVEDDAYLPGPQVWVHVEDPTYLEDTLTSQVNQIFINSHSIICMQPIPALSE